MGVETIRIRKEHGGLELFSSSDGGSCLAGWVEDDMWSQIENIDFYLNIMRAESIKSSAHLATGNSCSVYRFDSNIYIQNNSVEEFQVIIPVLCVIGFLEAVRRCLASTQLNDVQNYELEVEIIAEGDAADELAEEWFDREAGM